MRNRDDRGSGERRQDGAAAVEFAILMLLFVPLFLYTTFLYDMLRYRHEAQEAVITSAWDYTSYNYFTASRGLADGAFRNNRMIWCDHTGVMDTPGQAMSFDCDTGNTDHHKNQALAGHECWLGNGPDDQVTCQVDAGFHKDWLHPLANVPANEFQTGGHVQCKATLSVYNAFIPEEFMQEFSQTKLTENERSAGTQGGQGDQVHARAGMDKWSLKYEYALQADTWAIQRGKSKIPGSWCGVGPNGCADAANTGEVKNDNNNRAQYLRSKKVFLHMTSGYPWADFKMISFFWEAWNSDILMIGSGLVAVPEAPGLGNYPGNEFMGSNPAHFSMTALSPVAGTKTISRPDVNGPYYTTPYKFGSETRYEQTTDDRGDYYLGCQSPESC